MSQLVLPHTIDAGTEITAVEHQENYVAIRDLINGNLEGGSGSSGNLKVNAVTAREVADAILLHGLPGPHLREGLANNPTELKITPGAGLVLNYASGNAWVRDDSGLVSTSALIPVAVSGSTVTIAANSSGNPRIDRIILTLTAYGSGTVSVLQGTASVGATLQNLTGAAAVPAGAILLADILMPNGFAGPFVDHTHIQNRPPWSKKMMYTVSSASNLDIVMDSTTDKRVVVEYAVECAGLAHMNVQLNNVGTASYHYAGHELQLVNTGTLTEFNRGGVNGTGWVVGLNGTNVVSGGLAHSGVFEIDTGLYNSAWRLGSARTASSSVAGSGNHTVSTFRSAVQMVISQTLFWMNFFPTTSTFTGNIWVDRQPLTN